MSEMQKHKYAENWSVQWVSDAYEAASIVLLIK